MAVVLRVANYGRWVGFGLDGIGAVEFIIGWHGLAAWKIERGHWHPGSLEVVTPMLTLYASVGRATEAPEFWA